jgi:hypothetical protein
VITIVCRKKELHGRKGMKKIRQIIKDWDYPTCEA